jgi:hypothetical protein
MWKGGDTEIKFQKLNRQALPKAVEEYLEKQTACITEMRSPEYHSNCGALYECRQRLQAAYEEAAKIDVIELLNALSGVRYQYEVITMTWRKISAILDFPDLYQDEASQNRALCAVTALLATLPS